MRRDAESLLQGRDLGCCADCLRVHQRQAATLLAMAAWHHEWEWIDTLRLQALEHGHPPPPLTLPYFQVHPYLLPQGLPEQVLPSYDRCEACQRTLDEVRLPCRAGAGCRAGSSAGQQCCGGS